MRVNTGSGEVNLLGRLFFMKDTHDLFTGLIGQFIGKYGCADVKNISQDGITAGIFCWPVF
jgi:hypothetical protein